MKHSLNALINQSSDDILENLTREQSISMIQDVIHLGTKLRNRLLKFSIILPMGFYQTSISHLKVLINTVEKSLHGLVYSDIAPEDKQNFHSYEKITSDRVLNALEKYVPDSEATVKYLRVCRDITRAFTEADLHPLERVYMIWNSLYFLRAWRKWIHGQKDCYNLELNFISQNAFECTELNAYGILNLIVKFRDAGTPELFLVTLFSSQPCEHFFRLLRSMTTANWTKINFSMLEVLHMMNRVELQHDIAYFKLRDVILLPKLNKSTEKHRIYDLPTNMEIQSCLKKALETALASARDIGMVVNANEIRTCELKKGSILYKTISSTNASANVCIENNDLATETDSDEETNTFDCTYIQDYSTEELDIDGNSRFIEVFDQDGTQKIVRKSTLVWLMTERKSLSNDRLTRVQIHKEEVSTSRKRSIIQQQNTGTKKRNVEISFRISNDIQIGDCCIFKRFDDKTHIYIENGHHKDIIIGTILGFKYISGKTEKEKQYRSDIATVKINISNKRGLEVQALWYGLNENFTFETMPIPSFYINIENYVAHTSPAEVIVNPLTKNKIYRVKGDCNELCKSLSQLLS